MITGNQLIDYIQSRIGSYAEDPPRKRYRFRSRIALAIKSNYDKGIMSTLICVDQITSKGQIANLLSSLLYCLWAMKSKFCVDFLISTDNLRAIDLEGKWIEINNYRRNKFSVVLFPKELPISNSQD